MVFKADFQWAIRPPPTPTRPISKISEEKAACLIQKTFRGYVARQAFLSPSSKPYYKSICNGDLHQISLAPEGKSLVYITPNFVLKQLGYYPSFIRFHKMLTARDLLKKMNCSHLSIPKASIYERFLIEERFSIDTSPTFNCLFYSKYRSYFEKTAIDLVRLFAHAYLPYLINIKKTSIGSGKIHSIRYDNIPFYPVKKNGRVEIHIALIDLERLTTSDLPSTRKRVATVVALFPHHLEAIEKEAQRLGLAYDEKNVKWAQYLGKKYLASHYNESLISKIPRPEEIVKK